jgi:hypothetical protein
VIPGDGCSHGAVARKGESSLYKSGTRLTFYFTSSNSPGFHVLSNQGCKGP